MQMVYHSIRRTIELTYNTGQIEKLENELEVLQEQLFGYETTKAQLAGLSLAYQQLLDRADRTARENERLIKFTNQVDQLEAITNERDQLAKQYQLLKETHEALELKAARFEDQLVTFQRDLTVAQERANGMQLDYANTVSENQLLNRQLTEVSDRNLQLIEEHDLAKTALGEKLAEIEELKNEAKAAKKPSTRKPRAKKNAETQPKSWEERADNFVDGLGGAS
jgi:chromosome segregation ATPase